MLGTLDEKDKTHWRDFVKPLVHAYNCTKHEVTGYTPYELMFGRQPRLPVDLAFGLPYQDRPQISHSEYVKHLKSHLEESYLLASRRALKSAERNKIRFDKHVTNSSLEVNDRVLVRNVRLRGKHKLADKWEPEVYVVVKRAGDLPVYTVRPETKDGPLRTLHRDLLLPCGFLPSPEISSPTLTKPTSKPRTRQNPGIQSSDDDNPFPDSEDEDLNGRYDVFPVVETVRFSAVHDIGRSDGAVDISSDADLTNQEPPDDDTVQRHPVEHLPVDPPNKYSPVDPPNEYSLVDPPDEHSPVDPPDEYSPVDASGVSETNNVPEKDQTEKEKDLPVRSEDEFEATNVAKTTVSVEKGEQQPGNEGKQNANIPLRCSSRQREEPERLTYFQLGNPLSYVVQSLFQGLSTALVSSLNSVENTGPLSNLPDASPNVVTNQPLRACKGTCMISGGESVTLVK
ncbi:uncharacterized protein [Chanodichthys erythropterus]|uniref:uncharacterized protein n=1 Tax=Chanodichthys erythropterus TaxID=933992 RepID=UPI00351F7B32